MGLRWGFAAAVCLAVAACLFPDPPPLAGDGGGDGGAPDAPIDAAIDAATESATDAGAACDPSKPFTSIAPIAELDDSDDQYKPTLTPDELEIWYGFTHHADGGNVIHVMHARRTSLASPFGTPTIEAAIAEGDVDPAVTDDGLGLYYAKFGTVGSWDLFQTARASRSDAFGAGAQLPNSIQSTSGDTAPFVAFDRSLYFLSERASGNHVYVAPFVDGGLAAPTMVASLASSADELGVALTHDGLWAYVTSNRTDLGSSGGYDIFLTHRATTQDGFGPLTNESELGSPVTDRAGWVSWDACRLYFESGRNGQSDLFLATKQP